MLVDTLTISGLDSLPDAQRLPPRLPLKPDKPFDRTLFEISADSITFYVRNRGYPYGQIFRNYTVDRRERTADVGGLGGFLVLWSDDAPEIARRLKKLDVWTDYRGNALRLGPAPYLSDAQLVTAIERLREACVGLDH